MLNFPATCRIAPVCPDVHQDHPKPWRVADMTFIEIEVTHHTETQLRVEFDCGLRVVITDERQIPLAARLIEMFRAGKGGLE